MDSLDAHLDQSPSELDPKINSADPTAKKITEGKTSVPLKVELSRSNDIVKDGVQKGPNVYHPLSC